MEEKVCDRYSLCRPGASERDLDAVSLQSLEKRFEADLVMT